MSDLILTEYFQAFNRVYAEMYPMRNVEMINRLTHGPDRIPLADTGICFGVALTLKSLMQAKLNIPVELVYIYRNYEYVSDAFEDELVHCVLLMDGKFYDAINTEGVDSFSSLWFVRNFYKVDVHYIRYPERGDPGGRDEIPNKITPELYAAFEKRVGTKIERIHVYR